MKTIELTHGKVAIVDDEDYPKLAGYRWLAYRRHSDPRHEIWIAARNENHEVLIMHREILGLTKGDGQEVLHINGDRLDNRRANLVSPGHRCISRGRRFGHGKSQYKGVKKDERHGGWIASITIDGKSTSLGRFTSERDAALAYDVTARKTFGHLVGLNFPDVDILIPPKTMPRALRVGRASRYRGVFWCKVTRKWKVMMRVGSRMSYLGLYGCEDDAARAYDAAALRLGKGQDWLNFPDTSHPLLPGSAKDCLRVMPITIPSPTPVLVERDKHVRKPAGGGPARRILRWFRGVLAVCQRSSEEKPLTVSA